MNLGISANSFLAYLSSSLAQEGNETTIYLSGLKTLTGETIETANFSQFGVGRITIDPLSTTEIEFCSFTAVDAIDVSLTGAVRGLSAVGSDSATSRMPYHPVGTPVIISFGVHNINDLKKYIDDAIATVTAGTANVVTGLAGENVAAGNLVYLKSDGKWWKTDADTVATIDNVQMGICQGSGTTGNAITNGIIIQGLDTNQSGGTPGALGYVSNTAGEISLTAGTTSFIIGQFKTSTNFYFNFGYTNKYLTTSLAYPIGSLYLATVSTNPNSLLGFGTWVSWGMGRVPISIGAATKVATFATRASNVITVTGLSNTASNEFQTGQAVLYEAPSGAITGLVHNTTYYLIRTGNLTFSLATSLANAIAGTVISLSSDGTGTQTFTLTLTTRTAGETGGEETHGLTTAEIPAHTHSHENTMFGAGSSNHFGSSGSYGGSSVITGSTGGSTAYNNMPPFITCYIWNRTA